MHSISGRLYQHLQRGPLACRLWWGTLGQSMAKETTEEQKEALRKKDKQKAEEAKKEGLHPYENKGC
eukprot:894764-Prorocentrum_lima.AAC.1